MITELAKGEQNGRAAADNKTRNGQDRFGRPSVADRNSCGRSPPSSFLMFWWGFAVGAGATFLAVAALGILQITGIVPLPGEKRLRMSDSDGNDAP